MKAILSLICLVTLLSACNNTTKMKLRAPEPEIAEVNTVKSVDSSKTDTTIAVGVKN
ncbi:hypothetical protein [Pedobacter frigoris]|uniref:hypothetical protein n=1 Tax=Pedobacter frigoris TaxID=2571272 RepID=UPI00145E08DA|nr:hypothetical protein [Pedobacter frigoris]